MYKIVAIDADGTLLDKNSLIPEENKLAINAAQKKGVHIALCSGRSYVSLNKMANSMELDESLTHIISFNGAVIYDGARSKIFDRRMDRERALYLLGKLKPFKITTAVYTEVDEMLCESEAGEIEKYTSGSLIRPTFIKSYQENLTKDIYKVIIFGENSELKQIYAYMAENARDMPYDMVFSSKRLVEFSDIYSTKGAALNFVCGRLGFDMSTDSIAIGDSYNDMSMINSAALGVCMANGEDELKSQAGYVTEKTNHDCGVAEVINKFILEDLGGAAPKPPQGSKLP